MHTKDLQMQHTCIDKGSFVGDCGMSLSSLKVNEASVAGSSSESTLRSGPVPPGDLVCCCSVSLPLSLLVIVHLNEKLNV